MNAQEMIELCQRHTVFTWSAGNDVEPLPVVRAEGLYFWAADGTRYLDFNSQLMCCNIGHGHPKVVAAMKEALDGVIFISPKQVTEVRARLGEKLASLLPGDLSSVLFTLGGAESNEHAIRMARLYTGRFKILSRYRSYHGATNLAMQVTGDPRRWANEPGAPGVVRVFDPSPYHYSFGTSDAEITANNLQYLAEVIQYEGPQHIAAMIIESITGANGVLPPPEGYLAGLRELLDRHGILLICDEVMAGFGRAGRWFGFEHGGIVPDIVTMAKGLTGAYFPLGAVAVRQPIHDHFRENFYWGGLTYNSHPLGLATALAVIEVLEEEGLIENAQRLEPVMKEEMARLAAHHPCVKAHRAIGLFGMVDLQKNAAGEPMAPYNGTSEAMKALSRAFLDHGIYVFTRWGGFMCNPPLIINEAQLRDAYATIDKCLDVADQFYSS